MGDLKPRQLHYLRKPVSPFSEVHRLLQQVGEENRIHKSQYDNERNRISGHLRDFAVELFRLQREAKETGVWDKVERMYDRVQKCLMDAGVDTIDPIGEGLSDELLQKVDVLGYEVRSDIMEPVVGRVEKPIVKVWGKTYRGVVFAYYPTENRSKREWKE